MLLEDKNNLLFKYLIKCVTSQNKDAVVDDDINNHKYSEIIDMLDENWREIIIATSNNFNENCFSSRMFQNNNNNLRKNINMLGRLSELLPNNTKKVFCYFQFKNKNNKYNCLSLLFFYNFAKKTCFFINQAE